MKGIKPEWVNEIILKSLKENRFKNELLKNPKATIEKEFGLKVHEELIVFENSENVTHIVIPLLSTEELKQLSEKYEKSQNLEENIYWVLIKCLKDSDFKKAFMQNPKGVLEKECAIQLPEELIVKAFENTDTTTHLIIPYLTPEQELSEQDMERIAAGMDRETKSRIGTGLVTVGLSEVFRGLGNLVEAIDRNWRWRL